MNRLGAIWLPAGWVVAALVGTVPIVLPAYVEADDGAGAAPRAARIVLAGISADSAVPATPGDSTSGVGVAVQGLSTNYDGGLWVYGEVHNATSRPIGGVTVDVVVTSAAGELLETRTIGARVDEIAAGGNGPFRALLAPSIPRDAQVGASVASYRVEPVLSSDGVRTSLNGPRPVQIEIPDPKTHTVTIVISTTMIALDGAITNHSDHALVAPEVVVAVYDGNGSVVFVTAASPLALPNPGSGALAAGESATFTVSLPIPWYYTIPGTPSFASFVNTGG